MFDRNAWNHFILCEKLNHEYYLETFDCVQVNDEYWIEPLVIKSNAWNLFIVNKQIIK